MTYGNGTASRQRGHPEIRRQAYPAQSHARNRAWLLQSGAHSEFGAGPARGCAGYAGEEGQRTVMTTASVIASQEWSIPDPHAA
jgi:hypothetical protein